MPGRYRDRRRKNNLLPLIGVLAAVLVLLLGVALWLSGQEPAPNTQPSSTQNSSQSTSTTQTTQTTQTSVSTAPPVVKVSTATLLNTGDMLMHLPVVNSAYNATGKVYDFANSFVYLQDHLNAADLAVANLETTLYGPDWVWYKDGVQYTGYSGYPNFNCPDEIVSSLKASGFDMLLTANNHSYDTRSTGFHRTQEIIAQNGMAHLGTVPNEETPLWQVREINGIKIGMVCYTYQTDDGTTDRKALNGITMTAADSKLIASFSYSQLGRFYDEMAANMEAMEAAGAEAVVLYIHWGDEYRTTENQYQNDIAQKMCDLGVDVIVGGHPHVVQPMELLQSTTDEDHKTVCLYSMGNAISNQRVENMGSGGIMHTEDGVLFSFTFAKYSDGTVILEDTRLVPVWVNHYYNAATAKYVYQMLPLDKSIEDWKTQFQLTDAGLADCEKSFDRTMAIVAEGLTAVQEYLQTLVTETELKLGVQ